MARDPNKRSIPTYSEARERYQTAQHEDVTLRSLEGCLRHTTLSCWFDPRSGRMVFVVDSVSQWPNIEEVVSTTHFVRETGPFDSETIYRQAARWFRAVVEERYARLT